MNRVIVTPTKEGKYKVLVNNIQRGIAYSAKILAEHEAEKIRSPKKIISKT